jgi:serine phosphatase RsbU (regulator of sigma subunit)
MMPSFVIDRRVTSSLLGFKERYEMNEWTLMGRGDILLLHTDGLSDHRSQDHAYFPGRLEQTLRAVKHLGAREIYEAVKKDVVAFGPPTDDISLVVIKLK